MRTVSQHVYYELLKYLCTSILLVRWICCLDIYFVYKTLMNTLSKFNDAVWVQGQYVYSIANFITFYVVVVICFVNCHYCSVVISA